MAPDDHLFEQKKKRLRRILVSIELALLFSLIVTINRLSVFQFVVMTSIAFALFLCFALVERNRVRLASSYVVLLSTVLMLVFIWTYEGLKDEVLLLFPALVAFAILIGNMRTFFAVFLVTTINVIAIGILVEYDIMAPTQNEGGVVSAILIVIIFSLVSYCIYMLGNDLTEAVKKLTSYRKDLEDQVAQRTLDLQQSLEKLQATQTQLVESEKMASLGRLVAGVSHEINTPIGVSVTAISQLEAQNKQLQEMYSQNNLTRSQLEKLLSDQKQVTDLAQRNLAQAVHMINDFKSLAVFSHKADVQSFSLHDILVEATIGFRSTMNDRQIISNINCAESLVVYQNPEGVRRAVEHLVSNAIFHAFKGVKNRKLTIDVVDRGRLVDVRVADTGTGLSDELVEKVFEPFFTTSRNLGHTGLGLNIVYNLVVQILQGSIALDHTYEEGACFVITIPKKLAENAS